MIVAPNSPDWQAIRAWNEERIAAWSAELRSLICTETRAHQLRGMIFALEEQASTVEPAVIPDMRDPNYG